MKIYLTNLGKYTECFNVLECGKWVTLPITKEEFREHLKSIGVEDNSKYEEFFITDWQDVPSFISIDEYSDPIKISEILEKTKYSMKLYSAIEEAGEMSPISNLDELPDMNDYAIYADITTEESAGEYLMLMDYPEIPKELSSYMKYEKYYQDAELSRRCILTSEGLLMIYVD